MRSKDVSSLIGRETELELLRGLLPGGPIPRGVVAALLGEAGIGKTRLTEALVSVAKARGVRVVRGGAYEADEPLPYALLTDLFAQWIRDDPAIPGLARSQQLLGALGRLVPQFAFPGERLDRLSAQDERFRLFDAAAQLFRTAARDEPLVVVLEDVHWADRESWLMLRYIARAMRERAVLFLLTMRSDELGSDVDGLSDFAREMDLRRVVLRPLDLHDAIRTLESLAGERLPVAICETIHRESGGNPFYLRHVFEHLVEEGKLERRGGRWSANLGVDEFGIPPGVRSLLMRRIGRLSQGTVQLLRLASIYPDRFDIARLRLLVDASEDRLLDHIDEALGLGVIVARDGSYSFAHALLRRALYEAMNPDRRCKLHRRAAEQLARSDQPPGEIARQYNASRQIPGAAAGVAFALRAAERAAAAHLYEQRAMFLRIAADLQGASVAEELLCDLALAQADALDIDAAERTAQRVLEIVRGKRRGTSDPGLLDFLISLARRLRDAGSSPEVWLQFVEVGIEACGGRRDLSWARLLALRPRWQVRWVGPACEMTRLPLHPIAVEILQRHGDENDMSELLDPFESRTKEQTEELHALTSRWRSAAAIVQARAIVARDWMFWQGVIPTAADKLRELARDSHRFGSLLGRGEAYCNLVWVEAALGHLSASNEALREARSVTARLGPSHALHFTLNVAANTVVNYLCRGDWEPLRELTRMALEGVMGQQFAMGVFAITCSLMAEAFSPEPTCYEERVEALVCSLERTEPGTRLASIALNFGVVAVHERDDVKRALRFEKLVRESRGRGISGGPFGKAQDAALGMLAAVQGNNVAARKHFAEARQSLEREGLLCFGAIIDFQEARAVGAMGDIGGWRAALVRAHRRFDDLGMAFWKERAAKALASGAPAVRNPHAPGPDGLSRRELEVLSLLAAGSTAKKIASQLALSVATVNRHVANIYEKIGVKSRAAATAYALKHGISRQSP